MIEENNTNQDTNETESGHSNGPTGHLRGVFIGGAWAFIGLLLTAIFWPNLTERMKFFTGNLWVLVTAFAVIAQAVIYRKQWEIMRQQQQMAAISERAYIGIQDGKFVNPLASGKPPCLRMVFRNGGNTPAWHFRSHYRMVLSDRPLSELIKTFPVEYKGKQAGAFVPAGQIKRVETFFHFTISQSQIAEIIQKARTLYVFIEVEFNDFLGNWQHNSYRIAYNPEVGDLEEADVGMQIETETEANPN